MSGILKSLHSFAVLSVLAAASMSAAPAQHTFAVEGEHFVLDGKPFVIRSGEMHYQRVPHEYWHDRMKKMRALGLNTLTTYVFWNAHEPKPGVWDFTGDLDLAAYLKAAQEEGLFVLLRPGPYVCAEWDLGGLPSWLLAQGQIKIRSKDPQFLAAAERYIKKVGQIAAPFQVANGGPILMVQVENEYGSFGNDHEYTGAIFKMLRGAGFNGVFYTADGSSPSQIDGGKVPGAWPVINFGASDDPEKQFADLAKSRTGGPKMVGEFWTGWFDHWGEKHHKTDAAQEAKNLDWLLSRGIGVNLYMVHGGTSRGPMAGANLSDRYEPDISSYDYDAPIDEAGRLTPKFYALREVFKKYLPAGETLPEPPEALPIVAIPKFEFKSNSPLARLTSTFVHSDTPLPMEALGQSYGLILYRHSVNQAVKGTLELNEARDYALVTQKGKLLGVLDRRKKETRLEVALDAGAPLEILVDATGRVNFGPHLVDDRKGIVGSVKLNGEELKGWDMFSFPVDKLDKLSFGSKPATGPAFYRSHFDLNPVGDTFLDLSDWGKGYVWVNGHNLGRYWGIGPQQSLFCPGVWLKAVHNEIVVLDLDANASRTLQGRTNPVWNTPGN